MHNLQNDGKQQRIRIRGNWTYADEEWAKLQKKRREIEATKAKLYDDSLRYAIDKAEEQQEKVWNHSSYIYVFKT